MTYTLRAASVEDVVQILQLYTDIYDGKYPDRTFHSARKITQTIESDKVKHLFVAVDEHSSLVAGCVLFYYDEVNQLAKAGAAVVSKENQGKNITQNLLRFGIDHINKNSTKGMAILYITTRTVHTAAQQLTNEMGFKQIGIFPNVHKTEDYETHALAAMYFSDALSKRFTGFKQHPKVFPLFNLVREDIEMPAMELATDWERKNYTGIVPYLEVIEAPQFVSTRMNTLVKNDEVDLAFFPFQKPSILITSSEQSLEVFAFVNDIDKSCVITGCKIDREVSFQDLFLKLASILRDRGIRYIEVIIRANRLNIIDKMIGAKFIPCGYVPAFQLEEGKRYDYVVLSRSFEVLDFNNIKMLDAGKKYLANYINIWEEIFLGNYFKGDK